MDRRDALHLLARLAGAGAIARLAPDDLLTLGERVHALPTPAGVLTPAQRATAVAAMEAILPRTDTPGATDARTADFLDTLLAGWLAPAERAAITGGLDALDALAHATHGAPFARLTSARQLAMVEALDAEAQAAPRGHGAGGGPADAAATHWFAGLKWITVFGWATSRVTMEQALGTWPLPGRYVPDAPVKLRRAASAAPAALAAHDHDEAAR